MHAKRGVCQCNHELDVKNNPELFTVLTTIYIDIYLYIPARVQAVMTSRSGFILQTLQG